MKRIATVSMLLVAVCGVSGCVVASTAADVVGTAVSTTVSVAGTAVEATADVVGGTVDLVVPDGDDEDD